MQVDIIPSTLSRPVSAGRSEGIHLSGVIRSIAVQTKILTPDQCDDLSLVEVNQEEWWQNLAATDQLKISMGLAWEQWYIPQLPDVIDHPGEMCVDGVYMTHDGESLSVIITPKGPTAELCGHEVKLTYKSVNTVEGKSETEWLRSQFMWLTQMKGYCIGLSERYGVKVRTFYLHVLYVCGAYMRPIQPQLRVYRILFTDEEIDMNWELVTDYVQWRQTIEEGCEP